MACSFKHDGKGYLVSRLVGGVPARRTFLGRLFRILLPDQGKRQVVDYVRRIRVSGSDKHLGGRPVFQNRSHNAGGLSADARPLLHCHAFIYPVAMVVQKFAITQMETAQKRLFAPDEEDKCYPNYAQTRRVRDLLVFVVWML
jgi:hypothetical protein